MSDEEIREIRKEYDLDEGAAEEVQASTSDQ